MNALDAVAKVLRDANGPLHYREITEQMLARDLWATDSKKPWNSVYSQISGEMKRRGKAARFVRTGPGTFTLNRRIRPGIEGNDHEVVQAGKVSVAALRNLSFTDAAERILRESNNQEPLHYKTITQRAIDRGLIRTEGRTPAASMYSMVWGEVRRQEERGQTPRFDWQGRGMVGLTAWLPGEVVGLIEERNLEVREALLERARSGSPADFENLVGELLTAMGFEDVTVTNVSGDGGVDVRGTLVVGGAVRIRMAVQAKRWSSNVPAPIVQQVRGSLGAHEQGLIITTSDFSRGAKEEAERPTAAPVALIGGEQLAALLAEHQIGAHVESYKLYTLDEGVKFDD